MIYILIKGAVTIIKASICEWCNGTKIFW